MIHLCRHCNICHLGDQAEERVPFYEEREGARALLIDDNLGYGSDYGAAYAEGLTIMGRVPYTYTSTIRCHTEELTEEEEAKVLSRCAVWTHLLVDERKLVVCTKKGLVQLGIDDQHPVGDLFADDRVGIVIVIPPVGSQEFESLKGELKLKVRRAAKEVGI